MAGKPQPAAAYVWEGIEVTTVGQPAAADDRIELLLAGEPDREYEIRIEAQRCTLEMSQRSARRQVEHEDSPLFGGERQGSLF